MYLPKEALRFRIENYRDIKELVEFAELIGLPLTEAAAAAIEEGRLRYVTLVEFETYLYMCRHMLYPCPIKAKQAKPRPRLFEPPVIGTVKAQRARDREVKMAKKAVLTLQT